MFLTPAELRDLTGKVRHDAQKRALAFMGVPYRVRPDGSVAVLRAAAEVALGGTGTMRPSEPQLQP